MSDLDLYTSIKLGHIKVYQRSPVMHRFWKYTSKGAYVHPTLGECWIWTSALEGRGYGTLWVNGKTTRAHRLSYEFHVGDIPRGLLVCHHCDVRTCVNPEHLFLGTSRDNTQDMFAKGRKDILKGEKHGCAKITEEIALEIIRRYKRLTPHSSNSKELAEEFNLSRSTICEIARGSSWKHLKR